MSVVRMTYSVAGYRSPTTAWSIAPDLDHDPGPTPHAVLPDGRPLQRVGLPLRVEVAPTIAGLRGGDDEVLDAALALLGEP